MNVKDVEWGDGGNPRVIWSHRCKKLCISWFHVIENSFFQHIVDKCDCSGIKSLEISHMNDLYHNKNKSGKEKENSNSIANLKDVELFTKFAKKFEHLQRLEMTLFRDCDARVLLIWKLLQTTIEKNNGKVILYICDNFNP